MPAPFRTSRRVEFCDTDAAGIAHFSAFILFMEQAEHEFLRHLGLSVMMSDAEGKISWPRVSVSCDFQGSVHFEDVVDIDVAIERLGTKSITYAFQFTHAARPIAQGKITAVCCRVAAETPPKSIEIPKEIRDKLERGTN